MNFRIESNSELKFENFHYNVIWFVNLFACRIHVLNVLLREACPKLSTKSLKHFFLNPAYGYACVLAIPAHAFISITMMRSTETTLGEAWRQSTCTHAWK